MRRTTGFGILIALAMTSWAHAGGKPAPAARGPRFEAVTFVIRHRVFHDFRDLQRVKLNQDFILGDTDYSARVVQYLPDFRMDLEHRKIVSLSNQPNNPAFKIIVRKGKVPQDTTWGFLNSPPHFGARSYFAFQVVQIDFADRAPLMADTVGATPKMAAPPTRHLAAPATRDSSRKP